MQCQQCQSSFEIRDKDRQFYDQISPVFNEQKYPIPEPTLCPDCRQQKRLAYCNEQYLYPSQCDLCQKRILSQFPPHVKNPAYCRDCWHSDKWDATSYGMDFDFSRPFFEQFQELKNKVPSKALDVQGELINSDYIHLAGYSKNCYLIMHADYCEDCYYGYGFKHNKSCVDGFYNLHSELCYDCVDVHKCYGLKGCQDCLNCSNSAFLKDCVGVKNSFLCVGLREKEYCFENQQLTKEEYEKRMAKIDLNSYQEYQKYAKRLEEMAKEHIYKEYHGQNTQNSSGDYLINCKDTHDSFDCEDTDELSYCYQVVTGGKILQDIYQYGLNFESSYECTMSGDRSYHLLFCYGSHFCSDLSYCWYMEGCSDSFGCTQMSRKKYCILNKQYSKEEYEQLVPKIIEHMKSTSEWGQNFPMNMSPFGYNKTTAQMYYPLTKEDIQTRGWMWDDYDVPAPDIEKIIEANQLPDNTKDIPDDILNWAIRCEVTGKVFKLTPQELKFYRQNNLPIPRRHHNQRHLDRFVKRNPRKLWNRNCAKCEKEIRTSYSPDREEVVYCEACYLNEVY